MTGPGLTQKARTMLNLSASGSSIICFLAGTATLLGWRFGWTLLLPKLPASAPMAPDTATAFLLAALNLFLYSRRRSARFRIGFGYIFTAGGVVLGFLDRTHVPRNFNRVIFQQLGIYTPATSPHMALATGLGFIWWGLGLICLTGLQRRFSVGRALLAAICGTLLITQASLYLVNPFLSVQGPGSIFWDHWAFRMTAEPAILFLLLGGFLCQVAWTEAQMHLDKNRSGINLVAGLLASAGLLFIFWVVNINLSFGLSESLRLRGEIARHFGVIKNVNELVAAVREAESGQRGFLLTGNTTYLESYRSGLQRVNAARAQHSAEGKPWPHPALDRLIDAKLAELAQTIRLKQSGENQAALAIVVTGRGFELMAAIEREAVRENAAPEHAIARRSAEYQNTIYMVRRSILTSYGLTVALLFCAVSLFRKELQRRAHVEETLRVHETELEIRIQERTAELQASESRYRAMLEQAPFAVHILDRQGNSAGVNPAFERFFGVGTEALRGYNIWNDPQPVRQGTVELLKRTFAGEMTSTGTVRHDPALSTGTPLADTAAAPAWVEFFAYPVKSATGEVQEVVILCQNVTARETALAAVRESESHFRELTNTLPQIVWTETSDGVVDYYNDRWYDFTGFLRYAEQSWYPVLHPDDLKVCLEQRQISQINKTRLEIEIRMWDRFKNCYRWYLARSVPVLTPSGEVQRWVGTSTDIQDKKETEEVLEQRVRVRTAELENSYKLLQSKEESLRHSLAERDTLFREVHHRVKNNLQVISSLLRMHGQSLSGQPVAASALEEARRRVLSMAMIHERLYAHQHMNRIDFGEYTRTLTRELMRSFTLPDKKVEGRINAEEIELDVEQAIPCGLILNELMTNALKYAFHERSSGLITVTLAQVENGYIVLSVADDGVGLPEGFNWKKSKSMGLPIVDILARQLEGRAEIESHAGLKVTVRFPRRVLVEKAA